MFELLIPEGSRKLLLSTREMYARGFMIAEKVGNGVYIGSTLPLSGSGYFHPNLNNRIAYAIKNELSHLKGSDLISNDHIEKIPIPNPLTVFPFTATKEDHKLEDLTDAAHIASDKFDVLDEFKEGFVVGCSKRGLFSYENVLEDNTNAGMPKNPFSKITRTRTMEIPFSDVIANYAREIYRILTPAAPTINLTNPKPERKRDWMLQSGSG